MSGHEDEDDDAGLIPVALRAPAEPLRKSTNIFTSGKERMGDTSDMSALSNLQEGEDTLVFGGGSSTFEAPDRAGLLILFCRRGLIRSGRSQGGQVCPSTVSGPSPAPRLQPYLPHLPSLAWCGALYVAQQHLLLPRPYVCLFEGCICMAHASALQTEMTSVFNFFLCVVADEAALQEIKEVMIGGFLGTISGAGFATLAGYVR
jgi:hypothetical protein